MSSRSVGTFWWLSHWWRRGWRGIYSLHTKSNRYTQIPKLGGTEWLNSVRPTWFEMWTLGISVGSTTSTRWDQCARVREKPHLGETDHMNSVRPISVISKQRLGQANSVGPIAHFGETKMLRKGNREFALQTQWDRLLILVRPKRYKRNKEFATPSRWDRDPYRWD